MAKKYQMRNAIWGLIATVADITCGLYTSRLLLNNFGATAHGLINAINNFLSIIISIEFTFFMFWPFFYYQAFEKKDKTALTNAYHRDNRTLKLILSLAIISTAIIAFIYPLFYLDQFSYWDTAILVFALGAYMLIRYSTTVNVGFLNADYRNYIVKILSTFTTILTAVLSFLLIQLGCNLHEVKIMVALVLLTHPIFYGIYIKAQYKISKPTNKYEPIKLIPLDITKNIIRILLNSRVDILILSIVMTLANVSVYSIYAMIAGYMCYCVNSIFDGRDAVYGHAFINHDIPTAKKAYARTQFYLANVLGIVFGVGIVMMIPFIQLYTKFVRGVNYNQFWFGFFMLIAMLFSCIRAAQNKLLYTSGVIKHKNLLWDTIAEALINLIISIVLVFPLGITGVAIGTAVSQAYTVLHLFNYRRKYIFKTSVFHAIRRYIPTVILITIATFIAIEQPYNPSNKFTWTAEAFIIGIAFVVLDFILCLIINPNFRKHTWRITKKGFRNTKKFIKKSSKKFYQLIKTGFHNIGHFIKKCFTNTYRFIHKLFKTIIISVGLFFKKSFSFAFKAFLAMWQRGIFNAIRAYCRHKKAVEFENANPDMDDITYLTKLGKIILHENMNLENPQTLNEKINWLKVYGQREIYTTMSDKAAVKDFVSKKLSANYIIPTYGVWDSFDAIDWDSLPNSFVLKCTHDSGSVYFVPDKAKLDVNNARRHLEHRLHKQYWRKMRENGYQFIQPRIIAEQYLPSLNHRNSVEYKFTCFNGKVVFGTICQGYGHGFTKRRVNDFYTPDFKHLPWRAWYHKAHHRPKKPVQWDEMIAISEMFAQDIPYLRVDLYIDNDQIYFGEFTFYTGGGFIDFHPRKMDFILGQQLTLPDKLTPPPHPDMPANNLKTHEENTR